MTWTVSQVIAGTQSIKGQRPSTVQTMIDDAETSLRGLPPCEHRRKFHSSDQKHD
ncbi:hypothetical protein M404DRAFT_997038 [Pisolithus tinctorius Marx 270]|uniref:Uncharacterized protein n=1 Tax=Pisolithus tinctorius Marx 270 TaxID=870435 RepID=A0A0C3JID9_PISTI|nr:hypothetical protein M404DRAFT_997038 [Pisolithus tinctorius Marx 270]